MTVPEIWRGQNRGRKKEKKRKKRKKENERGQSHIASPTGIANKKFVTQPKTLMDHDYIKIAHIAYIFFLCFLFKI